MKLSIRRPIQFVATDVDGTLVGPDKTVSLAAKEAINRAIDRGLKVAIASGRAYDEMFEIFEKLPRVRYFICTNGAVVMDRETGDCLYHECFDKGLALEILTRLMAYDVYVEAYMGHQVFGQMQPEDRLPYFFNDQVRGLILASRTMIRDLYSHVKAAPQGPEKIQIFYGDPGMEARILADFKAHPGFDVLQSSEGNLEFVMLQNTKGTAVKALADRWGLSPDQVMTIGDSHNDMSMLSYAGVSVAMGNADQVVKELAKYQTDSNEQDGFARALEAVLAANERC